MEIFWLILFAILVWYFWDTLNVKELALQHVKNYAAKENIQVLDEVVSSAKLRFRRNKAGHLEWVRHFSFEFSSRGDVRYKGVIVMCGKKMTDISLEPYEVQIENDSEDT